MRPLLTGLLFLAIAVAIYAFNTESHTSKIVFGRFGLHAGETGTVTILLAIGLFLLGLSAFRWIRSQGALDDDPATPDPRESAGDREES